jgi:hypothetical protein
MPLFDIVSFDQIILAFIATVAIREALIKVLPETLAGPEGWLIRVDDES